MRAGQLKQLSESERHERKCLLAAYNRLAAAIGRDFLEPEVINALKGYPAQISRHSQPFQPPPQQPFPVLPFHSNNEESEVEFERFKRKELKRRKKFLDEAKGRDLERFVKFLDDQRANRRPFRDIDEAVLTALLSEPNPAVVEQKRRGPGKAGRNAPIERRYEWTVLSLTGLSLGKIADIYCAGDSETTENAVGKAARNILKAARIDKAALREQEKSRAVFEITTLVSPEESQRARIAVESDRAHMATLKKAAAKVLEAANKSTKAKNAAIKKRP